MKKLLYGCLLAALLPISGALAQSANHVTIYVVDLEKCADFYKNVMQLEVIPEPFHDNRHVWFRTGPHTQLHVVKGAREVTSHDINIHMAFTVPSVEDFMRHLKALHVRFGNWAQTREEPEIRPDGVKQIYLQDPEGYWIEVNDDRF
ncbi:MAG TPA: VOC family protein [Chitinophagaceae bacterium]|nr:VOC family protein [Chitinophagaceae bacterium]